MKVIVTEEFTLKDFDKLKNIIRKDKEEKGRLFIGDKFECDEEMFNYLNGNNRYNKSYVRTFEEAKKIIEDTISVKPKKNKKKKASKK